MKANDITYIAKDISNSVHMLARAYTAAMDAVNKIVDVTRDPAVDLIVLNLADTLTDIKELNEVESTIPRTRN